ncbi:MAG: hypothetical protein HOP10_08150 [Chitinophagaceae bacterium]|nr:hypothetical protein [Chitinophagaceae bacterium]
MLKLLKPLLATTATIIIVFVAVSLLDIVISAFYLRFYTSAAFIVTFGVGGVFAAVLGYTYGTEQAPEKNETIRWTIIIFLVLCGLLFFFLLSKIEGGEYKPAFMAYGITLVSGSFLFIKNKLE